MSHIITRIRQHLWSFNLHSVVFNGSELPPFYRLHKITGYKLHLLSGRQSQLRLYLKVWLWMNTQKSISEKHLPRQPYRLPHHTQMPLFLFCLTAHRVTNLRHTTLTPASDTDKTISHDSGGNIPPHIPLCFATLKYPTCTNNMPLRVHYKSALLSSTSSITPAFVCVASCVDCHEMSILSSDTCFDIFHKKTDDSANTCSDI